MANTPRVSIGSVPAEANSKGALNESVGPEVRNPQPTKVTHPGPQRGKQGEYLKATYEIPRHPGGATRTDH